ncbi:unnamed protein product, partial [Closterium sp. NIES-53]
RPCECPLLHALALPGCQAPQQPVVAAQRGRLLPVRECFHGVLDWVLLKPPGLQGLCSHVQQPVT